MLISCPEDMSDARDTLREKLRKLDADYYDKLEQQYKQTSDSRYEEMKRENEQIFVRLVNEQLEQAEREFRKGTPEGNFQGLIHREIARHLLGNSM